MYFDEMAERRVRAVWSRLADAGVTSVMPDIGARPHLSLAVVEHLDEQTMVVELKSFAGRMPRLSLEFTSVGVFPTSDVVFLAPNVTQGLLQLHERFAAQLDKLGFACHEFYRPGRWVPHCTVGFDLDAEAIRSATEICHDSDVFEPFSITAVGLIAYLPVRQICEFRAGR
jgi:2'-5' RNA ligase